MRLSLLVAASLLPLSASFGPSTFDSRHRLTAPDIDVEVPPGTPLEWADDLFRPVISARHGRLAPAKTEKPPPETVRRDTVVEQRVPEPLLAPFGQLGVYDYFRVTTVDIMRHISLKWPRHGKYDPDVPSSEEPDLVWEYPPTYPTELYWSGALNSMRMILHPEVVSARELCAYLLAIGEPALLGCRNVMIAGDVNTLPGPWPLQTYPVADEDVPARPPDTDGGETPMEQAVWRLVVTELTNGFPHALDPLFAHRTLALGPEAEWAVIEASRSKHALLARNAVSILDALHRPASAARLREILKEGRDPIMFVRAALAVVRRRDLDAAPILETWAGSPDTLLATTSIFALGRLGDPRVLPTLLKLARDTEDPELLWSLLPAIARLADDAPEVRDTLDGLGRKRLPPFRKQGGTGGLQPPVGEPAGTRDRILSEMLGIARAASGEKAVRADFLAKIQKQGLPAFQRANLLLLLDVLRRIGAEGQAPIRKVIDDRRFESSLRVAALQALRPLADDLVDPVAKLAKNAGEPPLLRTVALLALAERESAAPARAASDEILRAWIKRSTVVPAESAVAATAVQVLASTEGGLDLKLGIELVERALLARAWGARVTKESTRLTSAIILCQPPLLEIAVLELGRTGHPDAIPALVKVLKSRAGGGRPQAALALGAFGGPDATDALVGALQDPASGWVRYSAYRGLRRLSGQDVWDDWIFSPPVALRESIRKYRQWWNDVKK